MTAYWGQSEGTKQASEGSNVALHSGYFHMISSKNRGPISFKYYKVTNINLSPSMTAYWG